jgi:hypothetical protein
MPTITVRDASPCKGEHGKVETRWTSFPVFMKYPIQFKAIGERPSAMYNNFIFGQAFCICAITLVSKHLYSKVDRILQALSHILILFVIDIVSTITKHAMERAK